MLTAPETFPALPATAAHIRCIVVWQAPSGALRATVCDNGAPEMGITGAPETAQQEYLRGRRVGSPSAIAVWNVESLRWETLADVIARLETATYLPALGWFGAFN